MVTEFNTNFKALFTDIATLKRALYYFLHLPNPTEYNKAQVLELELILSQYEEELARLTMESKDVQ